MTVSAPQSDEYADFHKGYIAAVAGETDGLATLTRQQDAIEAMRRLTPAQAEHRYADDKWSVKEIVGHLSDAERVLSYRLLRIARGDVTPLPGFDEKTFAAASNAGRRRLGDLVDELAAVRRSTLALVLSLEEPMLARRGIVNDWSLSARGLVFIIAGHFAHHLNVLGERYGVDL